MRLPAWPCRWPPKRPGLSEGCLAFGQTPPSHLVLGPRHNRPLSAQEPPQRPRPSWTICLAWRLPTRHPTARAGGVGSPATWSLGARRGQVSGRRIGSRKPNPSADVLRSKLPHRACANGFVQTEGWGRPHRSCRAIDGPGRFATPKFEGPPIAP